MFLDEVVEGVEGGAVVASWRDDGALEGESSGEASFARDDDFGRDSREACPQEIEHWSSYI